MTRPTKERLEEIKRIATQFRDTPVLEVFAEIDALEKERDEWKFITEFDCTTCDQLRETMKRLPDELKRLAQHHLDAPGDLTQEQKVWAHDTILVASSWIENFVIRPALASECAPSSPVAGVEMNRGITLSMLKRLLNPAPFWSDVTLNMSSSDPTDEHLRKSNRFPFGPEARARYGLTEEEQDNMREDWITLRQAIREIEAHPGTYISLAVLKDNDGLSSSSEQKL